MKKERPYMILNPLTACDSCKEFENLYVYTYNDIDDKVQKIYRLCHECWMSWTNYEEDKELCGGISYGDV